MADLPRVACSLFVAFAIGWPVLVPHMQTALLERLTQEPQTWTQPELIARELAVRKRGKVLTF